MAQPPSGKGLKIEKGASKALEEHETKGATFSMTEIILASLVTFTLDCIAIVCDIFVIDVGWLLSVPAWLIFTFWFTIKGVKQTASLTKRFLIPLVFQFLPDWMLPAQLTISFWITAGMENHPEWFGLIQKATSAAEGKFSGAAGAIKK